MALEITAALIGLAGALIGGGISSLTSVVIARGEREKYRHERSWDLRREAYTRIIGALDRSRAITAHIADGYNDDPHNWYKSKANENACAQMVEHFHAARSEFHASKLMLSDDFSSLYEQMNRSLAEVDNPNLAPPERADATAKLMKELVPRMEAMAKRELGVKL